MKVPVKLRYRLWFEREGEYVLGGGSSHYMFLVLATKDLLES